MRKWEMCKSGYRPSNTLAYSAATKAACLISVQNCTDRAPKLKWEGLIPPISLVFGHIYRELCNKKPFHTTIHVTNTKSR